MLTDNQIKQIVDEFKQDPRILAILLTGSYIYGTPHEQSDLDVKCVVTEDSSFEEERLRFGVKVDSFFNTPDRVRFYMKQSIEEGHGACLHFWTHGKVVYDPQGIGGQLQKEASELWSNGRPDGQPWGVREEKYRKYL